MNMKWMLHSTMDSPSVLVHDLCLNSVSWMLTRYIFHSMLSPQVVFLNLPKTLRLSSKIKSASPLVAEYSWSSTCLLCEGGLAGPRHTSVSSDMTSSGLHLSRQQFFPLIHSCNEINQANSKSKEFNPGIWQLRCGPSAREGNMTRRLVLLLWSSSLSPARTVFTDKRQKPLDIPLVRIGGCRRSAHTRRGTRVAAARSQATTPLKGLKGN